MSSVVRVALAAALALAFTSGAMAQKTKASEAKVKSFTTAEKMSFDRASGTLYGGGDGGGSGGAGAI
jgi:hypothetical protein